jgi:hypothetical protein
MQTAATPLVTSADRSDLQVSKDWAAEDLAISLGILRECPYHGQPFKVPGTRKSFRHAPLEELIDPLDPALRVFNGNTRELLNAIERVSREYDEGCTLCAASEQDAEFD